MYKKFNVFALIVLIIWQTIIGPIGSVGAIEGDSAEDTTEPAEQIEKSGGEETEVDKSTLEEALKDAENYGADEYTDDSFTAFVEAVTAGKDILADEEATQDDVNEAVTAIEQVIEALQKQTTPEDKSKESDTEEGTELTEEENDKVDKTKLKETIKIAEEHDESLYTEASFKKLEKTISNGEKVLSDENVTQDAVDQAVVEINEAIDRLEPKRRTNASLFSADSDKFKIEIGTIKNDSDPNGEEYTNENPLSPNDPFWLRVDWSLADGHGFTGGHKETVQLPKQINIQNEIKDAELYDNGNLVGTFDVDTDGQVTITFTDYIENRNDINGWFEFSANLDLNNVEEKDGKVTIDPIGEEGGIEIPIDRSQIEKSIEKQGVPNNTYNGNEITWTVTVNKNALSSEGVLVTDILPEGTEYVDGSLVVEKQAASINGTPIGDKEEVTGITSNYNDQENELTINLGDINDVYYLTYTTKITNEGFELSKYQNNVTYTDGENADLKTHATVTIDRGEPLQKKVKSSYDPLTGEIEWELEFNYDQKSLSDVTLKDFWTPAGKVEFVEGSLKFQEVKIDENGNASGVNQPIDPSDLNLTVTKETDGFKVSGITTDKPYKITYKTKVTERVTESFDLNNKAKFEDNEAGEGHRISQRVGHKGTGTVDYENKRITWTVTLNRDKKVMNDVVVTDTLGVGQTLLPHTFMIKHGDGELDASTDYEVNVIDDQNFTISFKNKITDIVTITYETAYEADEFTKNDNNKRLTSTNEAVIKWVPEDETDEKEITVNNNVTLNENTYQNSWKHGSYDPESKEITWEIFVNYRENHYNNLKIEDTPQGNQVLDRDSIEVYELNINSNGDYSVGQKVENPNISGSGNEIEINIANTNKAYKVVYTTSVAGLAEMNKTYKNEATITGDNETIGEVDAEVDVYGETKYGKKKGDQDGKKINWAVEVNNAQQRIENLQFKDMIGDDQDYLADTIKVYEASLKSDGTLQKGNEYDAVNYELKVEDNEFTIDWKETVERPFIVEYSTLFFVGNGVTVENSYEITGNSITESGEGSSGGDSIQIFQAGGGASGKSAYLKVYKEDTTYGQTPEPIEGIKFELIDKDTNKVLKTIATDENGYADFGRLLFGTYIIKEVNPQPGYVGFKEQEVEIDKEYDQADETSIFTFDAENYVPNHDIELLKKDDQNRALESAKFTLFKEDGTEVETKTTDADGKITFENVEPGKYYVQETEAPVAYVLDDTKHHVEVTAEQKEPIQIEATNERKKVDISVEKIWKGPTEDKVTIHLLADGTKVNEVDLSNMNNWEHKFTGLNEYDDNGEKIEYTVEEVSVDGYTTEVSGNAEEGFTVTNVRSGETEVPVEKVWEDRDNKHELRPDEITVKLFANGKEEDSEKLSATTNWVHVFTNLPAYDAEGEKINYTVEEVAVDEYSLAITGDAEEGYTITNTVKDYAIGDYVWVDRNKDGIQDDNEEPLEGVKVELYDEDGNKIAETKTDENGRYIFDELPAGKYNVKFTLTEEQKENYRFTKEQAGEDTAVDSDADEETGWTREIVLNDDNKQLTKDYDIQDFNATEGIDPTWDAGVIELVQIPVEKIWDDNDNRHDKRPDSITFILKANDDVKEEKEVTANVGWSHVFKGLDKYDENGKEITYTVEEVAVDHYTTTFEETEDGFVFTNKLITYAIGDYVWVDRNKDGIQDDNEEPLEGVKVELYDKDGNKIDETETDENGRYIFDELPAGEYKVKFTLTEEQKEKYRFTKEQASDDTTVDSDADEETGWTREIILNDDNEFLTKDYDDQKFNATEGIDPTWDAGVIELVQVPVEKVWIDNDNAEESRPDAITVNLLANDELTDVTADLTAEDGWAHIFKGLDKYDENGEEIIYTIEEESVENYIGDIEETDEGFVITNRLTKELTPIIPITKVDVEKVWEGKALDEVTIILLADGEEVDRMTLSNSNNWKHTFNSLPKFSDPDFEQPIEYTVDEVEVEGYETTITGDMEEGFTVTNTEIPETPEDPKDPEEDTAADEGDSGSILPKTATEMFLWITLGLALIALGITIRFTRRRKEV